jgi:hypothetical protein
MNKADLHKTMRPWLLFLSVCLPLFAPPAFGGAVWVDWKTGTTQPFVNSSGAVGTVSYLTSDTHQIRVDFIAVENPTFDALNR